MSVSYAALVKKDGSDETCVESYRSIVRCVDSAVLYSEAGMAECARKERLALEAVLDDRLVAERDPTQYVTIVVLLDEHANYLFEAARTWHRKKWTGVK